MAEKWTRFFCFKSLFRSLLFMHYTEFSKLISVSPAEEYLVFFKSMNVALVVKMLVDFFCTLLVQIMLSVLAMSQTAGS